MVKGISSNHYQGTLFGGDVFALVRLYSIAQQDIDIINDHLFILYSFAELGKNTQLYH